jgi:hypothetical protein
MPETARPFLARFEIRAPDVTDADVTMGTDTGPGGTSTPPTATPPQEPDTMWDLKDTDF